MEFENKADRYAFIQAVFKSGYLLYDYCITARYEERIRIYEFQQYLYLFKSVSDRVVDVVKLAYIG